MMPAVAAPCFHLQLKGRMPRRKSDPINVYVPGTFDPLAVLPPPLHRYADYATWLISLVSRKRKKKRGQRVTYPFIYIHHSKLDHHFPENRRVKPLRRIKDALVEAGVLEIRRYRQHIRSNGFRLTPKYRDEQLISRKLVTVRLITAISKWRRKYREILRAEPFSGLRQDLAQIRVDRLIADELLPFIGDRNQEKHLAAIEQGRFRFKITRYGRVDHNLTNLDSDLRACLTYQGKSIVNVDLSCSQPTLLCLITKRRLQGVNCLTSYACMQFPGHVPVPSLLLPGGGERTGLHGIYAPDFVPPSDVLAYEDLCSSGRLYEALATGVDSSTAKKLVLEMLFGRVCPSPLADRMEDLFPTVWQTVLDAKRHQYKDLALILQKIESSIFLHVIFPRLRREGIWAVSLHDSFLCLPEHSEAVREACCEELEALLGFRPLVRVKSVLEPAGRRVWKRSPAP
jgi:hypothetical protein